MLGGDLIGNADHIHAQGVSDWEYALTMGVKVIMAGVLIAVIEMMMAIIFQAGNLQYSLSASVGGGLLLYVLADWLYHDQPAFTITFVVSMGMIGVGAAAAGLHGITSQVSLAPIFNAFAPLMFGLLFAMYLLEGIARVMMSAFRPSEHKELPTLGKMRRMGLLMAEEIAEGNAIKKLFNRPVLMAVALMCIGSGIALFSLLGLKIAPLSLFGGVVAIAGWISALVMIGMEERKRNQLQQAVIERLKRENKLLMVTSTVTTFTGWELQGKHYEAEHELISVGRALTELGPNSEQ